MAWTMLLWLSLAARWASRVSRSQELRVGGQPRVQHLDGHQPVHAQLPGLVDGAHRPLAELFQQLVAGDLLAEQGGQLLASPAGPGCAVRSPAADQAGQQRLGARRRRRRRAGRPALPPRVSRPRLTRALGQPLLVELAAVRARGSDIGLLETARFRASREPASEARCTALLNRTFIPASPERIHGATCACVPALRRDC